MEASNVKDRTAPWNKGKLIGQKLPLKLKEIWAIRIRLQLANRARELALFNLSIDSKLRGCDLVGLHVYDVAQASWHRQAGTSCDELKDLGGWKSRVMVDRYAKFATEHLTAAASRIESVGKGKVVDIFPRFPHGGLKRKTA